MGQFPASLARRITSLISGLVVLFCVWALGHTWTISSSMEQQDDFRG